jgi:hypothetical protein
MNEASRGLVATPREKNTLRLCNRSPPLRLWPLCFQNGAAVVSRQFVSAAVQHEKVKTTSGYVPHRVLLRALGRKVGKVFDLGVVFRGVHGSSGLTNSELKRIRERLVRTLPWRSHDGRENCLRVCFTQWRGDSRLSQRQRPNCLRGRKE